MRMHADSEYQNKPIRCPFQAVSIKGFFFDIFIGEMAENCFEFEAI